MANQAAYVAPGETVPFVNSTGAAIDLNDIVVVGALIGLLTSCGMGTSGPNTSLANGSTGQARVKGVVEGPKLASSGGAVVAGQRAYWDDTNNRFTPIGSGVGVYEAGVFYEAATEAASRCKVDLNVAAAASGINFAGIADSTQVENTTTETAFDVSKTIKGAKLAKGDVLEVLARVFVEDNNSTDTLNLKLYVGTEEICATGAVDVADNDVGYIHAFVTIREIGASGKVAASGVVALGVPGTVTAKPFRKAEAAEDLSGDVAIAVKATWSVAHADNECELEDFIVIHHKAA